MTEGLLDFDGVGEGEAGFDGVPDFDGVTEGLLDFD